LSAKKRTPRKSSKRVKKKPPTGLDRAILCARAILEKKAQDLMVLDIHEMSSIADYFVMCHGSGDRQVQAIAQSVIDKLRTEGVRLIGEEGFTEGRWVLLDCGDVVVHVFEESCRRFYDLERLWIHAEEVEVPEE